MKAVALIAVGLLCGLAITYGGFSKYRDQRTGVPGEATVRECEGGTKYDRAIRCTGTWVVGGPLTEGGHVAVGRIEGAGHRDEGRTIDVRIHGTDHATKPSLATPIVLWGLGGALSLLCAFGLVGALRRIRRRET